MINFSSVNFNSNCFLLQRRPFFLMTESKLLRVLCAAAPLATGRALEFFFFRSFFLPYLRQFPELFRFEWKCCNYIFLLLRLVLSMQNSANASRYYRSSQRSIGCDPLAADHVPLRVPLQKQCRDHFLHPCFKINKKNQLVLWYTRFLLSTPLVPSWSHLLLTQWIILIWQRLYVFTATVRQKEGVGIVAGVIDSK